MTKLRVWFFSKYWIFILEIIYCFYKCVANIENHREKNHLWNYHPNNHVTLLEHILDYFGAIDVIMRTVSVYDEFSI